MKLGLSDEARNASLRSVSELIDAGGAAGRLELLDSSGKTLSVLRLSFPCASRPVQGVLQFNEIFDDPGARGTGLAEKAEFIDSDGSVVLTCDVSDERGDGIIKMNSNEIAAGGPVRIKSFRLSAPK